MMRLEYKITMKENGRLVLPIKIRKQLGVETGDQLLLVLNDNLTLVPLKTTVRQIQQEIRRRNTKGISLVDALKEMRQEDFEHE